MVQHLTEEGKRSVTKKKLSIVALIDEEVCTGCEVCIEFCPVDCIIVAGNPRDDVFTNVCRVVEDDCISCKLCVKECPWECIAMVTRKGMLSSSVVMDVSEKPLNDLV